MEVTHKSIKKATNTAPGFQKIFNQILGNESLDINIVSPKYSSIRKLTKLCFNALNVLFGENAHIRSIIKEQFIVEDFNRIIKYTDETISTFNTNYPEELTDPNLYKKLREDDIIRQLIHIGTNLKQYDMYLSDQDKLDWKFIYEVPGNRFCPFQFSGIDIVSLIQLLHDRKQDIGVDLVMKTLFFLHKYIGKIYNIITTPDIDVKEFSSAVLTSLREIKKRPELSRCNEAFKCLENSISMMEDNFGKYHRDFIKTNNPTIMLEDFIKDVSKNEEEKSKGNHRAHILKRQFAQITNFYQNQVAARGGSKDSTFSTIFGALNNTFGEVDKYENIKPIEKKEKEKEQEQEQEQEKEKEKENGIINENTNTAVKEEEEEEEEKDEMLEEDVPDIDIEKFKTDISNEINNIVQKINEDSNEIENNEQEDIKEENKIE